MAKLVVLSVHYKYPELLLDQYDRIRQCAASTRAVLNLELHYFPIVHHRSVPEVVETAQALPRDDGLLSTCLNLRDGLERIVAHGPSLTKAFQVLTQHQMVSDKDWIAVMDHDAHPLHVDLFSAVGQHLRENPSLAGIGIPQWQRGHCYLHPSFLLSRVALIRQIGAGMAFKLRGPAEAGKLLWDAGEGFTVWCEQNDRPLYPLWVHSTQFPWPHWDSDMIPDSGAAFTGEYGEPIQVGNLMRYGLENQALVSHLWLLPLESNWFANYEMSQVMASYTAEPLIL